MTCFILTPSTINQIVPIPLTTLLLHAKDLPSHSMHQPAFENPNSFEPQHPECSPHPKESRVTLDEAAPKADFAFPSEVTGTLYVPKLRTEGKRLTRKPAKFCSPLKYGILSRPPPNMDAAMNLHAFLCADNSILRMLVQMPLSIVPNS